MAGHSRHDAYRYVFASSLVPPNFCVLMHLVTILLTQNGGVDNVMADTWLRIFGTSILTPVGHY
jgi:hypothetical protein